MVLYLKNYLFYMRKLSNIVRELYCYIFGHRFIYSRLIIMDKRICKCCYKNQHLNHKTNEWEEGFKDDRNLSEILKHFEEIRKY